MIYASVITRSGGSRTLLEAGPRTGKKRGCAHDRPIFDTIPTATPCARSMTCCMNSTCRRPGHTDGELYGIFLRDENGAVIGGADGWTWGATCYVKNLIVPEAMRGQGLGTKLMDRIEQEAVARQCALIGAGDPRFPGAGILSPARLHCSRHGRWLSARVSKHHAGQTAECTTIIVSLRRPLLSCCGLNPLTNFVISIQISKTGERPMIGYVTLGTKDMKKSAAFYDKIAAEMGVKRFMESDTFIAWGSARRRRRPWHHRAVRRQAAERRQWRDGRARGEGQGAGRPHLQARAVARRHRRRRAGHRAATAVSMPAYFRDLDGNKLNAFVMG